MNTLVTVAEVAGIDDARTEAELFHDEIGAGNAGGGRAARSSNHWIVVDRSWAKRLGLRRVAGVYRIRSKDLVLRLALLAQGGSGEAPAPRDQRVEGATRHRHDPDRGSLVRQLVVALGERGNEGPGRAGGARAVIPCC